MGSPAPRCWARRRLLSEVEASGQQRSSRAGRHRRTAVARGQANRTVRRTVRRAGAPPSCWARHRAVARGRPDRTVRSCWARGRPLAREAACWVRRRVVGCGAGCCCCPIPRRSDSRSGATSGCCPQSSRVGRRHPGGVGCCHRALARGQPDRTVRRLLTREAACWVECAELLGAASAVVRCRGDRTAGRARRPAVARGRAVLAAVTLGASAVARGQADRTVRRPLMREVEASRQRSRRIGRRHRRTAVACVELFAAQARRRAVGRGIGLLPEVDPIGQCGAVGRGAGLAVILGSSSVLKSIRAAGVAAALAAALRLSRARRRPATHRPACRPR